VQGTWELTRKGAQCTHLLEGQWNMQGQHAGTTCRDMQGGTCRVGHAGTCRDMQGGTCRDTAFDTNKLIMRRVRFQHLVRAHTNCSRVCKLPSQCSRSLRTQTLQTQTFLSTSTSPSARTPPKSSVRRCAGGPWCHCSGNNKISCCCSLRTSLWASHQCRSLKSAIPPLPPSR